VNKQTIVNYDAQGRVVSTTVVNRSGCGCGAFFAGVLILFVILAPASYAAQGSWPLGWAGAVIAYIIEAVVFIAGIAAAVQRAPGRRPLDPPPPPPPA